LLPRNTALTVIVQGPPLADGPGAEVWICNNNNNNNKQQQPQQQQQPQPQPTHNNNNNQKTTNNKT